MIYEIDGELFNDTGEVIDYLEDNIDWDEVTEEILDSCYPNYKVAGYSFTASEVIKYCTNYWDEFVDKERDYIKYEAICELDRAEVGDEIYCESIKIKCLNEDGDDEVLENWDSMED